MAFFIFIFYFKKKNAGPKKEVRRNRTAAGAAGTLNVGRRRTLDALMKSLRHLDCGVNHAELARRGFAGVTPTLGIPTLSRLDLV